MVNTSRERRAETTCAPRTDLSERCPTLAEVPDRTRAATADDHRAYAVAKRVLDVVGACLFMVLFSWLYLLIAFLVKLTSHGPVIYVQTRVGQQGREFPFYKFRSMVVGADDIRHHLSDLNEADGPVFKIRDDPRVTPIGRLLRRFSLDEIPQMLNVLRGDMSLVGPRPPLPDEVAKYSSKEWGRLGVRPGLTCLWQVNGRSDLTFDQWVELDLQYIAQRSLRLDLAILLRTVPAVLSGRGAC